MTEEPKFKTLSQIDHARMRTEMYLGSRVSQTVSFPIYRDGEFRVESVDYVPALFTAFREATDNALDEITMLGKGSLFVEYDEASCTFSVADNGRGIPLDYDEDHKAHIATIAVSHARAGRNFDERGEVGGTNGLGISIVNMVSEFFELVVCRDGKVFSQSFQSKEGLEDLLTEGPKIVTTKDKNTGTAVRFRLDPAVFPDRHLPSSLIESYLRILASLRPAIHFHYNGEKLPVVRGGMLKLFTGGMGSTSIVAREDDRFQMTFYVYPGMPSEYQLSMVNNIPAIHLGKHMEAFEKSFADEMIAALEKESKKRKLKLVRADVTGGVFIINDTRMQGPNFDAQSKTRLTNTVELARCIPKSLKEFDWVAFIKSHKAYVEDIFERCAVRMGAKNKQDIDDLEKSQKKKKVVGLTDATSKNRKECILALFEGDSALGLFSEVRDVRIHGSLPLRGKLYNTWGLSPVEIIKNEAIAKICAAIGLVPGKRVNVESLRYGEVQIWTDADTDGSHISSLLIALFYGQWPELFDQKWLDQNNEGKPFIRVSLTPLYILAHKKTDKCKYFYPGDEYDPDQWPDHRFVMRAKGLSALYKEHWIDHINDDASKFAILDDGLLRDALEVLFVKGKGKADGRKNMMSVSVEEFINFLVSPNEQEVEPETIIEEKPPEPKIRGMEVKTVIVDELSDFDIF